MFHLILANLPSQIPDGPIRLDLAKVFAGSPIIYTVLLLLSLFALTLWLYTLLSMRTRRMMPRELLKSARGLLAKKEAAAALQNCQSHSSLFGRVLSAGLAVRGQGHKVVVEAMEAEGRRNGATLWQRISLLNDIAVIAPMLGLLGTVLGMFYAFYDVNRTGENLSSIFDGLGIAIGTTVAGLLVAILAMLFYTTLKVRAVKLLADVESEALGLAHTVEEATA